MLQINYLVAGLAPVKVILPVKIESEWKDSKLVIEIQFYFEGSCCSWADEILT